ncbi:MAG: phosphoribosylformylglycinamidine synthase subunit PurQ [Pseudomonadota bacterium]|nr:phosphoribosylformylglycinamidine synthase subunit PurQ [Pseudomonadota bacterium]
MEIFQRRDALTKNQLSHLLSRMQLRQPKLESVEAHACFFLWTEDTLTEDDKKQYKSLLSATYQTKEAMWDNNTDVMVTAREGSEAQESLILQSMSRHCKIPITKRIVCAMQYRFITKDHKPLTRDERNNLIPCIHDTTSHKVLWSIYEMEQFFRYEDEFQQAIMIDLSDLGKNGLENINGQLELGFCQQMIDSIYHRYTETLRKNPFDIEIVSTSESLKLLDRPEAILDNGYLKELRSDCLKGDWVINPFCGQAAIYYRPESESHSRCMDTGLTKIKKKNMYLASYVQVYEDHDACPYETACRAVGFAIAQTASIGRGSTTKAHILGIATADISVEAEHNNLVASPRQTWLDGNKGAAYFANQCGVPLLAAFFRSSPTIPTETCNIGLDKPVLYSKTISQVQKGSHHDRSINEGDEVVILGAPVMVSGDQAALLAGYDLCASLDHIHHKGIDFLNINQTDMQVRCHNVIQACSELEDNPICVVEPIGPGGLTKTLLHILKVDKEESYGFHIQLRRIHTIRKSLTPALAWCSEMQERFLVICPAKDLKTLLHYADREKCPYATIGRVIAEPKIQVYDDYFDCYYMDMPHRYLTKAAEVEPKYQNSKPVRHRTEDASMKASGNDILRKILMTPTVGCKDYLLKEHNCYQGGLVVRGPYIGPEQTAIGTIGIMRHNFIEISGEAFTVAECMPLAVIDAIAAAKQAITLSMIRMAAGKIDRDSLHLELQWLCASKVPGSMQDLNKVVQAVVKDIRAHLGVNISESKIFHDHELSDQQTLRSAMPPSCIVSATAKMDDVTKHWIPKAKLNAKVVWCRLYRGDAQLAGSIYNQIHSKQGNIATEIDLGLIQSWLEVCQELHDEEGITGYHAIGEGGLAIACTELMIAWQCGMDINLDAIDQSNQASLFSDAPGVLLMVEETHLEKVMAILTRHGIGKNAQTIGDITGSKMLEIKKGSEILIKSSIFLLESEWLYTAKSMLKDHGGYHYLKSSLDKVKIAYDDNRVSLSKWQKEVHKPKVGILVEAGMTGSNNLRAACLEVGFAVVEFSLSDIINHHDSLLDFSGLLIPSGSSYQQVPKPGRMVAMQILKEPKLRDMFRTFFHDETAFTLGVGEGANILDELKSLIPGANDWPCLVENTSNAAEYRWVLSSIPSNTSSILLQDMDQSILPIYVAHSHGHYHFRKHTYEAMHTEHKATCLQYVGPGGMVADSYQENPTGSDEAIAGCTNQDGRITALVGLPENGYLATQIPHSIPKYDRYGPWIRLFINARKWVEAHPKPEIRF